jgi:hypothetical protein
MTESLTWLALIGLITIASEEVVDLRKGPRPRNNRFAHGLLGDASHLVAPFYFAKRGFENVARIIKR